MPRIKTLPCVFLSYAREDRDLVERLASELQRAGIEVWADFTGLEFGTPDWETAIRDALEQSLSILLVASPASRKSPHVRSELLLAESRHLSTYVVWVAGKDWIDAIPLKLAHTQYLDLRDPVNVDNFALLTATLLEHGHSVPSHFIYESFYTKEATSAFSYRAATKRRPAKFMEIRMSDLFGTLRDHDSMDTLFVNSAVYSSLAHLLDTIYVDYLSDRYPPFSYGRDWHLRRERWGGAAPLAVDWWFTDGNRRRQDHGSLIDRPSAYGLSPGSVWHIVDGMPSYTVALAAYDKWLIDTIIANPKAAKRLMESNMTVVDSDDFRRAHFAFVAVLTDFFFGPPQQFVNKFLIQTSDCRSEIKARWW